jgi:hypothetical protein
MMGIKGRLREAERMLAAAGKPPCPECGGRIVLVEVHEGGEAVFPLGDPCAACAGVPPAPGSPDTGAVGRVEVMIGGAG